jgi:hypothetical protein
VCGEARAVLRAEAAYFLFNGCQLEVSTDESVRHIRGCVDDYAQGLRLKAFHYLNVGCGNKKKVESAVSSYAQNAICISINELLTIIQTS